MNKVNFPELIETLNEKWEIMDLANVNDSAIRFAKVEGAYHWHTHPEEDEFFLVLKGRVFIDTDSPDGTVELDEKEGYLVKRGTRHRSRTEGPAWVMLVEPTRTKTRAIEEK